MESVIKEGALRLLTAESTCDVILCCQGKRLMAHKVVLSVASPVFRDLFIDSTTVPSVVILPDISNHIMTLILDYIYTGKVAIDSKYIQQFLSTANLLRIKLEDNQSNLVAKEKTPKKLPGLIPIKRAKKPSSCILPSPWTPRIEPKIGDPRIDLDHRYVENDSNNNRFYSESAKDYSSFIDNSVVEDKLVGIKNWMSGAIEKKFPVDEIKEEFVGKVEGKSECSGRKEKPFKCEECGKSFSQLRNFKYHRSVHEGTKEFAAKCPECGKIFNDKGYLSSHMKIHRDKKEYACPHCPKRFNQRVAYNMHLRIHTGLKPHECATCGKSFSRKMLLKQHQRVHTGERPYTCPECGKSFADRSNMSLHTRLHTGIKPYSCSLCSKSFTKKHHLKTHMNFHTGLKPYKCQKCGLAFSQSSNMRTHYKKCLLKHQTETQPEEEVENKNLPVN